jgi:hypothetical protein
LEEHLGGETSIDGAAGFEGTQKPFTIFGGSISLACTARLIVILAIALL